MIRRLAARACGAVGVEMRTLVDATLLAPDDVEAVFGRLAPVLDPRLIAWVRGTVAVMPPQGVTVASLRAVLRATRAMRRGARRAATAPEARLTADPVTPL